MREGVLVLILLAICVGFGVGVDGFWNARNLLDRSRYWVETGLVATAMTFVIATGGIDLSVGSLLALSATVAGVLWRDAGWPIAGAGAAGLATGVAAGAINGLIVVRGYIPPLVVTLATMATFRGLAVGLTQADPVRNLPTSFQQIGQGTLANVPTQLPIGLLIGVVGVVALRRSWIGAATLALGENSTAARFAGLPVGRLTVGLYAASGFVCALAGLIFAARYGYVNPETAGVGFELEVIAAVVIGGTRITGGSASVAGTLLGVLILDLLRFGLQLSGTLGSREQMILVGVVVVATAVVNEWWARRRATAPA